jgi:hypothetical protein
MIEEAGATLPTDPVGTTLDADLEDEALASAARAHYRKEGIASIEPDGAIRSALCSDEQVLAFRPGASVERLSDPDGSPASGPLAVTTKRLLFVPGQPTTLASLEELDDVTLATDRLLVLLTSGTGFRISTVRPRLLRVQLAEARASRLERRAVTSSRPLPEAPPDNR